MKWGLVTLSFLAFAQFPTFEVASVKPSPPVAPDQRVYFGPPRGGPGTPDPANIIWTYATMKNLLMTAYDVKAWQLSGPAWIDAERYDIAVKVPAGTTKQQLSRMWQHLLAERFGLIVHHESREFQVEELVIAKGGSKLKETSYDLSAAAPPGPPVMKEGSLTSPGTVSLLYPASPPKAHTMAIAQPMAQLTEILTNQLNRPVIDKTGLTGRYDFALDYAARNSPRQLDPAPSDPGDPGPDITEALQEQLGLRLVPAKAKLDVVVVDKLQKLPTAN